MRDPSHSSRKAPHFGPFPLEGAGSTPIAISSFEPDQGAYRLWGAVEGCIVVEGMVLDEVLGGLGSSPAGIDLQILWGILPEIGTG